MRRFVIPAAPDASGDDPLLSWRAAALVWLLPALADAAGTFVAARVSGAPAPFWRAVVHALAHAAPTWGVWVPLTAAVFWLARRVPLLRALPEPIDAAGVRGVRACELAWRSVAVHAGASLAAALVHAAAIAAAAHALEPTPQPWGARLTGTLGDWLPVSLLLYWMTLGAAVAFARVREAREQDRRAAALETRLAQAELAVLRAQLEPHFLFNALNTAVSLVRAGEPAAGVDVLTRLADVLRYLLDRVAQETPLADELRLLDSYLGIARARFGARLTVTLDVPPALGDAVVPGLALQPLVENALRHGVGRRDGPGHVWVDAWVARRGPDRVPAGVPDGGPEPAAPGAAAGGTPWDRSADVLCMRVRDDGPGLGAEPAAARHPSAAGAGVGLRNLRNRLERLYGRDRAGLILHEREGGGAEATVWLPLRGPGAAGGRAGGVLAERA